jgi:phasin
MATSAPNQAPFVTDMPRVFRDVTEKGVAETKQTFEKMTAAATDTTEHVKAVYVTSLTGIQDYGTKVLEFTQVNMTAAMEHAKKLATAKSPTEYFQIMGDYAKTHMETLSKQAQELAAIGQRIGTAATEMMKSGLHKVA